MVMTATTRSSNQKRRPPRVKGTAREEDFLSFVADYLKENGYAPSYEEIREALGLRSKGSVFNMMRKLSDDGKIVYTKQRARTLRVV